MKLSKMYLEKIRKEISGQDQWLFEKIKRYGDYCEIEGMQQGDKLRRHYEAYQHYLDKMAKEDNLTAITQTT